ncbi:hypothetical protein [Campylobacter rectus]|uniref:hypothetical protein n=1 Tax=Campylobacter rectus TaxID=203 RepID=UPI0023F01779|nr:hypothetical protein [Campylobacter rectus]
MPTCQKQHALVVYDYGIFVVVSQIFSKFCFTRSNLKCITKARELNLTGQI